MGTSRQIQAHQVLDETTWAFGEEIWARGNANVADFLADVPKERRYVPLCMTKRVGASIGSDVV
jgi:hypothetical protein